MELPVNVVHTAGIAPVIILQPQCEISGELVFQVDRVRAEADGGLTAGQIVDRSSKADADIQN